MTSLFHASATSGRCACICGCGQYQVANCNDLCEMCWRHWCEADGDHEPIADRSYLATYGMTTVFASWLISRAPHRVAEPAAAFHRELVAPVCPDVFCGARMVFRPGAWKCYRHGEPVVVPIVDEFPGSPRVSGKPIRIAEREAVPA